MTSSRLSKTVRLSTKHYAFQPSINIKYIYQYHWRCKLLKARYQGHLSIEWLIYIAIPNGGQDSPKNVVCVNASQCTNVWGAWVSINKTGIWRYSGHHSVINTFWFLIPYNFEVLTILISLCLLRCFVFVLYFLLKWC